MLERRGGVGYGVTPGYAESGMNASENASRSVYTELPVTRRNPVTRAALSADPARATAPVALPTSPLGPAAAAVIEDVLDLLVRALIADVVGVVGENGYTPSGVEP